MKRFPCSARHLSGCEEQKSSWHHAAARASESGFTLIEILIVLSIIAILAALIFPTFARVRENGRRASCQSNMKQLGLAFQQYTQDNDELLPNVRILPFDQGGWMYLNMFPASETRGGYEPDKGGLYPYVKSTQVYVCPSDGKGRSSGNSYSANGCVFHALDSGGLGAGKHLASFDDTAQWLFLAEESSPLPPAPYTSAEQFANSTNDGYLAHNNNGSGGDDPLSTRHLDGSNVLFLDGHVKWFRPQKVQSDNLRTGGQEGDCP
jgi:prepilin-type N-terminal cleavage/methylation domain-containing protein/prepilin-type processing-associated H-X9-DG protein